MCGTVFLNLGKVKKIIQKNRKISESFFGNDKCCRKFLCFYGNQLIALINHHCSLSTFEKKLWQC